MVLYNYEKKAKGGNSIIGRIGNNSNSIWVII